MMRAFMAMVVWSCLLFIFGCDQAKHWPLHEEQRTGRIELLLVGEGASGARYRLRDAVIGVEGPNSTTFFETEDDPDRTSWTAVATVGSYQSFLQEGWRLERIDHQEHKSAATVEAVLVSPNPAVFEVLEGELTVLPLRFRVSAEEAVIAGAFEIVLEVEEAPGGHNPLCSTSADCFQGQTCCLAGLLGTCTTLAPGQNCPLPDLTVTEEIAFHSLRIRDEVFSVDSCAVQESCIDAPGLRRLLAFSTETPNIGEADLILGDPTNAGFEYAPCHNHYHFDGYALYELLDATGNVVAMGRKQAFCLLDSNPLGLEGAPTSRRYHCGFQGIQRGWSDTYGANLDCQWIDVTEVPSGDYLLRITVNPDRILPESNYDNNVAEVPVTIPNQELGNPLAPCASPVGNLGLFRDCGWQFAEGFEGTSCTPGESFTVSCGCSSSCSGDPVMRVCAGDGACLSEDSIGMGDDACGRCPMTSSTCPASGKYSVLVGSYSPGAAFSCDVVLSQ